MKIAQLAVCFVKSILDLEELRKPQQTHNEIMSHKQLLIFYFANMLVDTQGVGIHALDQVESFSDYGWRRSIT